MANDWSAYPAVQQQNDWSAFPAVQDTPTDTSPKNAAGGPAYSAGPPPSLSELAALGKGAVAGVAEAPAGLISLANKAHHLYTYVTRGAGQYDPATQDISTPAWAKSASDWGASLSPTDDKGKAAFQAGHYIPGLIGAAPETLASIAASYGADKLTQGNPELNSIIPDLAGAAAVPTVTGVRGAVRQAGEDAATVSALRNKPLSSQGVADQAAVDAKAAADVQKSPEAITWGKLGLAGAIGAGVGHLVGGGPIGSMAGELVGNGVAAAGTGLSNAVRARQILADAQLAKDRIALNDAGPGPAMSPTGPKIAQAPQPWGAPPAPTPPAPQYGPPAPTAANLAARARAQQAAMDNLRVNAMEDNRVFDANQAAQTAKVNQWAQMAQQLADANKPTVPPTAMDQIGMLQKAQASQGTLNNLFPQQGATNDVLTRALGGGPGSPAPAPPAPPPSPPPAPPPVPLGPPRPTAQQWAQQARILDKYNAMRTRADAANAVFDLKQQAPATITKNGNGQVSSTNGQGPYAGFPQATNAHLAPGEFAKSLAEARLAAGKTFAVGRTPWETGVAKNNGLQAAAADTLAQHVTSATPADIHALVKGARSKTEAGNLRDRMINLHPDKKAEITAAFKDAMSSWSNK